MKPFSVFWLHLFILGSASITAYADGLNLDQEFFSQPYRFGAGVGSGWARAQTFTVGLTGILERADLQLSRDLRTNLPATLELRSTVKSGAPDMTSAGLLSTATVQAYSIPFEWYTTKFTTFDFGDSAKIVTPGQLLALVLTSESPIAPNYWYLWTTSMAGATPPPPQYLRGSNWVIGPGGADEGVGYSGGFRTFVNAIPEPTSGLALAIGLCGLGAIRRRYSIGRLHNAS